MKTFVFGLDSATFDIIIPLIRKGKLPTISKLMDDGSYGILKSTIPPHSAPAWIAFMIGENPGKHGAFGWRTYDLSKYSSFNERLVTSHYYRGKTIFDYLGSLGKRVVSFNVPTTYPVWEINGYMVAGYPTPDECRVFSYPRELEEKIEPFSYLKIDKKLSMSAETQIEAYEFEDRNLTNGVCYLLEREKFELFAYVTGILDSAQHTLWKYRDPDYPLHEPDKYEKYGNLIEHLYSVIDKSMGLILKVLPEDTNVFVVSDHGAGSRPTAFFHTNFFLCDRGYLATKNPVKRGVNKQLRFIAEWAKEHLPMRDWVKKKLPIGLKENISKIRSETGSILWKKTKAYRVPFYYPYDAINLNVLGRQPEGMVRQDGEYESVRDQIIQELKALNQTREDKLITEIYKKEDIYSGPFLKNVPDIIFRVNDHLDPGPGLDCLVEKVPKSLLSGNSGYHRMEGIFIASGPDIAVTGRIDEASMFDVAPTLLHSLQVPVPENMDGRALNIFTEEHKSQHPVVRSERLYGYLETKEKVTTDEEAEMKRALKSLGYME